jgi:hypothetical protein
MKRRVYLKEEDGFLEVSRPSHSPPWPSGASGTGSGGLNNQSKSSMFYQSKSGIFLLFSTEKGRQREAEVS